MADSGPTSLCCLIVILVASGCATPERPGNKTPSENIPSATVPALAATRDAVAAEKTALESDSHSQLRLTVATVGDIMLGTDYPDNHLPDDDGVSFLHDVTPWLQSADLAIGNLEGVLMDGGEPRKECSNPQACYLFRTPSRYAEYFVEAGFDVLSLANNHSRDFGEDGRTASMRNLAAAGIKHTGRRGDFALLRINGLDIAVLGYAVTRNSNLLLDYEVAAATVRE